MMFGSSGRPSAHASNIAPLHFRFFRGCAVWAACLLVLVPFWAVVATSLADQTQVTTSSGFVLWPSDPTLNAYRSILSGGVVTRALTISVLVTLVGTALSLVSTSCLAYAMSRPGSFGHRPILFTVLGTVLFAPGIIPSYLMVKQLGLLDTYWSLILPAMVSGFNVLVVRAFMMELPRELLDAARIDGAGDVRVFWSIVLPLSKAPIAVVGLFYAVAYWNSYFTALLYLDDNTKWPLQLVLRAYVVNQTPLTGGGVHPPPQQSIQMAMVVLAVVPILAIYPFVQRHFTKGVLLGGVQG